MDEGSGITASEYWRTRARDAEAERDQLRTTRHMVEDHTVNQLRNRDEIVAALMGHAREFRSLHHARVRLDANAANLIADIVLGEPPGRTIQLPLQDKWEEMREVLLQAGITEPVPRKTDVDGIIDGVRWVAASVVEAYDDRDAALAERDAAVVEREEALGALKAAVTQRDEAWTTRDEARAAAATAEEALQRLADKPSEAEEKLRRKLVQHEDTIADLQKQWKATAAERDRLAGVIEIGLSGLRKMTDDLRENGNHTVADATASLYRTIIQESTPPRAR